MRAYVDIPYVALVLGRDPGRGARPRPAARRSSCSPSPGLLRPEAWLFSLAYVAWQARPHGCCRSRSPRPVIWMAHDLVLAGDPLHSLLGTRDNAEVLERMTGLGAVPLTVPRRLGEILREPGLLGAAAGGAARAGVHAPARGAADRGRASSRSPRSACSPPPACRSSAATCCCPPRCSRSSAARASFGWLRAARATTRGARRWAAIGARRAGGVRRLRARPGRPDLRPARARWARRRRSSPTCTRSPTTSRCRPVAVPNHRPVPHVALWTGIPPGEIVSAQLEQPTPRRLHRPGERARRCATSRSTRATRRRSPRERRRPGFEEVARERRSLGALLRRASLSERKVDRAPAVEVGLRGLSASLTPAGRPRNAHR